MPAVSKAQQRLMAIAEHDPDKVFQKNVGVLKMKKKSLRDFAATDRKGLPKKASKNVLKELMQGKGLDKISKRADGGPVEKDKPYLVGEDGPEIIMPTKRGVVVSDKDIDIILSEAEDHERGMKGTAGWTRANSITETSRKVNVLRRGHPSQFPLRPRKENKRKTEED
jgi:hypothetical protein